MNFTRIAAPRRINILAADIEDLALDRNPARLVCPRDAVVSCEFGYRVLVLLACVDRHCVFGLKGPCSCFGGAVAAAAVLGLRDAGFGGAGLCGAGWRCRCVDLLGWLVRHLGDDVRKVREVVCLVMICRGV